MMRRGGVLACLLMISCGQPDAPKAIISGDTTFVHSEQPVYARGTLRELSSIGAVDGPDEYVFTQITASAVGPSGEVYVADLEGDVRRFDADGRFERVVSRIGRGPGETLYVIAMATSPAGELAVIDRGNIRVSVWSAAGDLLHEWTLAMARAPYGRDALFYDDAGELWLRWIQAITRADADDRVARPLFVQMASDGSARDTVFAPVSRPDGCVERELRRATGFWEDNMEPFLPMRKWARGQDGTLVTGCPAQYEFEVLRPDGRVTKVSRAWTPQRSSREEVAFFSKHSRAREQIPDTKPAYQRLWVADDGRIWTWPGGPGVKRYSSHLNDDVWSYYSPLEGFDVFDVDGRWLGRVQTPTTYGAMPFPGVGDPLIRGDTVWAVTVDEWGANYVTKFVVEWHCGGGSVPCYY
jgi:hypothetical protein